MTDVAHNPRIDLSSLTQPNNNTYVEEIQKRPEALANNDLDDTESYFSIETGEKLSRLGHIAALSSAGIGLFALQQEQVESGGLLLVIGMNLGFMAYAIKEDVASRRRA